MADKSPNNKDRKMVNCHVDCIDILNYFREQYAIPGMEPLSYSNVIRRMGADLGYKKKK